MEEHIYFKVNQIMDEKDYTAFSRSLFSVILSQIIFGLLCVNMFTMLVVNGFSMNDGLASVVMGVVFLPVFALLIVMIILYPAIMGKNLYKNYVKVYGVVPIQSEVVFTENGIYDTDPNGYRRYSYRQIEKVVDKPEYCFIMFNKQSGLIIKKNCFTVGDPAALKMFVDSKRFDG